MSASLRILAIIAAHNEADIIARTIEDLVDQGIEVYLLDHASTDGTADAARAFLGRGLLRIEPYPDASIAPEEANRYSQGAIMSRKEQLARELEADWFITHDADEFRESPWSHLNLREGIELVDRLGFNAIDFQVLNFWPTHDGLEAGGDVREAFLYYVPGDPWDKVQVKCWKNTGQHVDLASIAGHDARFEGRRVFPIRFLLRHYPIRSQAHGVRKVFEQRLPRFAAEERARGWHVQYDSFQKDHSFIRDPSSLRLYDPEAVRVELQLRHRGVEDFEHEADALRQRHAVEVNALHSTLARHESEAELAARQLAEQARRIDELSEELQRQQLEAERQRRDAQQQQQDAEQRRQADAAVRQVLEEQTRGLRASLDAIYVSKSWRWTAPLRAVRRLLRRP
jgi:hypothetical protein